MNQEPLVTEAPPIEPFSIDHLLLAGFIYDVAQLNQERIEELDRRHQKGELNKYFLPYPQRTVTQRFRMVAAWAHPNWVGQYQYKSSYGL